MAKKTLLTANGVYSKAKKGFLTVNSTYRKVQKAYLTIGGVYRPCWSSGLEYYGTITPLSEGVTYPAATSTENFAFFAGGEKNPLTSGTGTNRYSKIVNAYDKSFTKHETGSLTLSWTHIGATSLNTLAFFAGGSRGTETKNNDVYVVDESLSTVSVSQRLTAEFDNLSATSVGDRVIFGGGILEGGGYSSSVFSYTASLTREDTRFVKNIGRRGATTVGNHAMFVGGMHGNASPSYGNDIDVFDSSLTTVTTSNVLSQGRAYLSGAKADNFAIFAGGIKNGTRYNIVDVFDSSLTQISGIQGLSEARSSMGATSVSGCAMFIAGEIEDGESANVDMYDTSLTRTNPQPLPNGRNAHGVTSVRDVVLIAGGHTANTGYETMTEAYVYF